MMDAKRPLSFALDLSEMLRAKTDVFCAREGWKPDALRLAAADALDAKNRELAELRSVIRNFSGVMP